MVAMAVRIKRVYEPPSPEDGYRVLVDRLWPRGLKKEEAAVDLWAKELAPTTDLRQWFGHDPSRWEGFQRRYREELKAPDAQKVLAELKEKARHTTVTLLFAAKDEDHNNAVVLQELLEGEA
ncbi:MAG: DUF488 domain-containing protein [Clostridiales bacterium]|nr:DUF488 domain-containing protein [Clostridiales bacterium]